MSYPCEGCIISMTCEDDCDRIKLKCDNFIYSGLCPDCGNDNWKWYFKNHESFFKCHTCRANFRAAKREQGEAKTSVWDWYIAYTKDRMINYFYAIIRLGKGDNRIKIDDRLLHPISSKQLLYVIKREL